LIAEWDKKLRDSGFVDIEDRKTGLLKKCGGDQIVVPEGFEKLGCCWTEIEIKTSMADHQFNNKGYSSFVWKQSQAEYYRIAAIMFHDGEFKNLREKEIWGFHSEGVSTREIAKKMGLTQRQVFYTIQTIEKRFGLIPNDKQ